MVESKTKSDVVFDIANYSILTLLLMAVLYPLIFVVSASFSDPNDIYSGKIWLLPINFTVDGYIKILETTKIWMGYLNTIIYTTVGTIVNLLFTITAAYALSRKDFMIRNFLMGIYVFTMFFSGGLVPGYLVVKSLGLLNTMWALILPGAVSTWNLIVCYAFFKNNIPEELLEASKIDGCDDFKFFIQVVVPLSGAIIAIMIMFYAVGHWNSYFNALMFITDRTKYPLQLILRDILLKSEMDKMMIQGDLNSITEQQKMAESIKYGVIIVSSLPVLMIYPFVQKHFVKGILVGSLKG